MFCAVFILTLVFEHFLKKMTLIGYRFPNLRTPKDVVRWMSKKSRLWGPFDRQQGKRAGKLIQSQLQHLYHIHWSLWTELSLKKSLFVTSKILRRYVNTLTADNKCSLFSRGNLMQHLQMHLPQKQKKIPQFFCAFSKSRLNFEHFQKSMTPIAYVFPKIRTPKDLVR